MLSHQSERPAPATAMANNVTGSKSLANETSRQVKTGGGSGPTAYKDWPNDVGNQGPVDLKVTGTFPAWAAGTLLRVGPGVNKIPRAGADGGDFHISHWFDGLTTCHKFTVGAPDETGTNKVTYTSRGQTDDQLEYARKVGSLGVITFGQKRDPCDSFYKKVKTMFEPQRKDSVDHENVGVAIVPAYHKADKTRKILSATTDRAVLKQFDIDTLESHSTTDQKDLNPALKGPLSAAHPSQDPKNGDLFNYNLDLGPKSTYRIFRTNAASGTTDVLATISDSSIPPAYIHSLFLTENYVVLCVWPAIVSRMGISILWERNVLDALQPFDRKDRCTWLVVDRKNNRGLVKKYTSPAMFAFHTTNAWEEKKASGGDVDIVAEVCQFETTDILHNFYYENLMSTGPGAKTVKKRPSSLARYRLSSVPAATSGSKKSAASAATGKAECILNLQEPLCGDLPNINPNYKTRPSRYVWSVIDRGLSSFLDAVGKTDAEAGDCKIWSRDKHTPSEPIFIPNPEAKSEDDGVLLVVVLDGPKGTSYLLCLDAATMQELARAESPVPAPFTFHGVHLAA